MSKLVPKYKFIEALEVAVRLATRALEEVRELARMPGPPGADGMGFDDMHMEYDGERTFSFVFRKDGKENRYDFAAPLVLDRGVFKEGQPYVKGDGVSFGGCFWIAQKETNAKPGTDPTWRLAVKKGRDAKDPVKL